MSFGTRYNKYIFAQNCTTSALLLLFIRLSTDLRHVDRLRVEAVHQLAEDHAVPEQECEVVRAGGRGEARVAGRHHLELVQPPQTLLPQRLHPGLIMVCMYPGPQECCQLQSLCFCWLWHDVTHSAWMPAAADISIHYTAGNCCVGLGCSSGCGDSGVGLDWNLES